MQWLQDYLSRIRREEPMEDRVSILIYCHQEIEVDDRLSQILFGIEEEGLPYDFLKKEEEAGGDLAKDASKRSRLGVGIGIGRDGVSLYEEKLCGYGPVSMCALDAPSEELRAMGMNGARLIKGLPLVIY